MTTSVSIRFRFASIGMALMLGASSAALAQDTPLPGAISGPPIGAGVAAPAPGTFQPATPAAEQAAPAAPQKAKPKKRRVAVKKGSNARVAAATSRARVVLKDDPRPTFTPSTFLATANAAQRYLDIAQSGGWPKFQRLFRQEPKAHP